MSSPTVSIVAVPQDAPLAQRTDAEELARPNQHPHHQAVPGQIGECKFLMNGMAETLIFGS